MTCSFQHLEPGTEPFTPEQEFGEMTLSHHDHYEPTSDEDSEEDELEFDSGSEASVSSDEEVVVSE